MNTTPLMKTPYFRLFYSHHYDGIWMLLAFIGALAAIALLRSLKKGESKSFRDWIIRSLYAIIFGFSVCIWFLNDSYGRFFMSLVAISVFSFWSFLCFFRKKDAKVSRHKAIRILIGILSIFICLLSIVCLYFTYYGTCCAVTHAIVATY